MTERMDGAYQRARADFVSKELLWCVSELIGELSNLEERPDPDTFDELYRTLLSPKDAASGDEWRLEQDAEENWYGVQGPEPDYEYNFDPDLEVGTWVYDDEHYTSKDDARDAWLVSEGTFLMAVDEDDAWEELCDDMNISLESEDEVFEHWLVTNWMARRLREQGEQVVEYLGLTIWCRTCTDQAPALDGCMAAIFEAHGTVPPCP